MVMFIIIWLPENKFPTRYSLLATRYSLLATRYSLLATRYSLLATLRISPHLPIPPPHAYEPSSDDFQI